jgi:hypothetical protein
MSTSRTKRSNERRVSRQGRAGVPVPVLAVVVAPLAAACAAYPTHKAAVPVDCSVTSGYTFKNIDNCEGESLSNGLNFFGSADNTPGAAVTFTFGAPTGGVACDGTQALEATSAGSNDWGSLMGFSNFGTPPRDASQYEGLSFWAMVGPVSSKAITILFDDPNTYNQAANMLPAPPTANCRQYPKPDGGTAGPGGTTSDTMGNIISSGSAMAPSPPDGCGNEYQTYGLTITNSWQFYTIPWSKFQQQQPPQPNQVPNAVLNVVGNAYPGTSLITSRLMTFIIRFPKAVETDLWLDDIAFYAHQGWVPSPVSDAGVK